MPDNHSSARLTRVYIDVGRLTRNLRVLQECAGDRPLWPCVKANAYGHGAEVVTRHLLDLGCRTFGVADVGEAAALIDRGVDANFIVLSVSLPEHAEALVAYGCEPVVCKPEMVRALAEQAQKRNRSVSVHVKVDTGMGRIGVPPERVTEFLDYCRSFPAIRVRGLMSHFASADAADKQSALAQLEAFREVIDATSAYAIELRHMANSAAVFDVPDSHFDAVRPGIAVYGLRPSAEVSNPLADTLEPVLEWRSRIVFLKEVPAGTGLSYGHAFRTAEPSLIATVPVGYGDGLSRRFSNELDVLIGGMRCRQVGRITMDMCLVDVTPLRGRVSLGDEVVLIGRQGNQEITADELAEKLGTINYEIVTCIAERVPRVVER